MRLRRGGQIGSAAGRCARGRGCVGVLLAWRVRLLGTWAESPTESGGSIPPRLPRTGVKGERGSSAVLDSSEPNGTGGTPVKASAESGAGAST